MKEQPQRIAIMVPRDLLERVWAAINTRRKLGRSQVVDQALAFVAVLYLGNPELPRVIMVAPPAAPRTEVYAQEGLLLEASDVLQSHDLGGVCHTALIHALNSLEHHGHTP